MHVHLPKPLHGWREFLGEVGIIGLGVLIALAAEQLVETWHWHREVHEFRDAIDRELGSQLDSYRFRMEQEGCVRSRLATLDAWRAAAQAGRAAPLPELGRPAMFTMGSNMWNTRGTDVMAHMSLADRLKYSTLYQDMAETGERMMEEREAWLGLAGYAGASRVSGSDLIRFTDLLNRAKVADAVLSSNWALVPPETAPFHLQPSGENGHPPANSAFCRPLPAAG